MKALLKNNAFVLLFIMVCSIALFAQTLTFHFTDWDDPWLITQNQIITKPSVENLQKILFDFSSETRKILGKEYLPVRDIALTLNYAAWGNTPWAYHFTNVILYAIGCFLLFLLLKKYFTDETYAFLLSILFLVHPVHVESVAWISEIKSLLCFVFLLLGLIFFLRFSSPIRKVYWFLLSVICFSLAVFSKSTGIVFLPFTLLCTTYLSARHSFDQKRVWLGSMMLGLVTLIHFFLALHVGKDIGMVKEWMGGSIASHFMTIPFLWAKYALQAFLPVDIKTVTQITPIASALDWRFWCSAILFLALFTICLWKQKRQHLFLLSFLCFTTFLLPVLQFVSIPNRYASRYLFLPSLALVFIFLAFKKKWPIVLFISFYATLSIQALPKWENCVTLWTEAATHEDHKEFVLTNLFRCYKNTDNDSAALRTAALIISMNPKKDIVWTDIGEIALRQKKFDEAKNAFTKAFEIHHRLDEYQNNLALILLREGKLKEAEKMLRGVLSRTPSYPSAWKNLGYVMQAMNKPDLAREYFQKLQAPDKEKQ